MGPEKKVENEIKHYLLSLNGYLIKTLGGSVPAGTPDIIACVNGLFVAIEVKKPNGGIVSELQKHHIRRIQHSGGFAFVARSKQEVENYLQRYHII